MRKIREKCETIMVGNSPVRKCTNCGEWLPLTQDNFFRQKRDAHGFSTQCKPCVRKRREESLQEEDDENIDKVMEQAKNNVVQGKVENGTDNILHELNVKIEDSLNKTSKLGKELQDAVYILMEHLERDNFIAGANTLYYMTERIHDAIQSENTLVICMELKDKLVRGNK